MGDEFGRRVEIRDDIDIDAAVNIPWGSGFGRFVTGSNGPVGPVWEVLQTVLKGLRWSGVASKVASNAEKGY